MNTKVQGDFLLVFLVEARYDTNIMLERWGDTLMRGLLLRLFVKNYADTKNPAVRSQYGKLAGWVGIFCNILLFAGKLLVGTLCKSVSITADAFNNLSDASSSVVTLLGFKLSEKPADREHPYGHHRMEYLSGLCVAAMILLVGAELIKTSASRILHPEPVEFSLATVLVLVGSILLKLWMAGFNRKLGAAIDSAALSATAADSRNDVIATGAVLASCLIGKLTGARLDGWTGLLVALFILWSGIGVARDTINPLLGMAPDEHLVRAITQELLSHEKVLGVHDLMIHDYGPGRRFASAHVEMDYREDVLDAHECIDEMEREVRKTLGVELVIHYDPIVTDDEELSRIHTQVAEILRKIDPKLTVHDFRMVRGSRHTNVIFDLVLPFSMEDRKQELRELVERELQTDGKEYHAIITFDTQAFNAPDDPCDDPEKT